MERFALLWDRLRACIRTWLDHQGQHEAEIANIRRGRWYTEFEAKRKAGESAAREARRAASQRAEGMRDKIIG